MVHEEFENEYIPMGIVSEEIQELLLSSPDVDKLSLEDMAKLAEVLKVKIIKKYKYSMLYENIDYIGSTSSISTDFKTRD